MIKLGFKTYERMEEEKEKVLQIGYPKKEDNLVLCGMSIRPEVIEGRSCFLHWTKVIIFLYYP